MNCLVTKDDFEYGLNDILDNMNSLNIDADNSHQQNGERSLEDGEIKDNSVEISEKVILKTSCQETISSGVIQSESDPAKWNLLELPKPVNPNDLPVTSSDKGKTRIFDTLVLDLNLNLK